MVRAGNYNCSGGIWQLLGVAAGGGVPRKVSPQSRSGHHRGRSSLHTQHPHSIRDRDTGIEDSAATAPKMAH
ncbi:hypothetical protein Pcinc_011336 [Petrolisthes cinctipes]|uniref:Uncharacterized protein n=1 Tax=Petrolisthes cinctipes TaxID=88211 RepID=A0AAE1BPS4_PETCI|nr:hypothetical protein Pcinc_039025 [Petrolisthes cinctipes]KAK3884381.1 hypothetical protein Pcinc_011336 [Petrolisthes cinctipes]